MLQPMEQSPGCYVIFKGWVGTIFNVFNRIYFRLNDGTEYDFLTENNVCLRILCCFCCRCCVTDEENERINVHIKETDKKVSFCFN